MFDLEAQLTQWTKGLSRHEAIRLGDVVELEQHVRDSVAALTSRGLTTEEAFLVATHRLGSPGPLAREFEKVNQGHLWLQRLFWVTAGALGFVVSARLIDAAASLGQLAALLAGGSGTAVGYTAAVITCLGWAVVAAGMYWRRMELPGGPKISGVSAAVISAGVVLAIAAAGLLTLWSRVVLPNLMPVAEINQALLIANAASGVSTVLMPLILLTVMLQAGRRISEDRILDR